MGSIPTAGIEVTTRWARRFAAGFGRRFGVTLGSHLLPAQVSFAQRDPRLSGGKRERPACFPNGSLTWQAFGVYLVASHPPFGRNTMAIILVDSYDKQLRESREQATR